MSCNGCQVLRKGCSESCVLRPSLQWIETGEAQGHATVFVAKFFGHAGLMSFISAVPEIQRPACGMTISPVNGAVGLLWTENWHLCQAAVETVLRGGTFRAIPELAGGSAEGPVYEGRMESPVKPRKAATGGDRHGEGDGACDLHLFLSPRDGGERKEEQRRRRRTASPSMNSEGSMTTSAGSGEDQPRLLNLFI